MIFIDNKNAVISYEIIARGTIDEVVVYPRNFLAKILDVNASAVILAHNHPSGNLEPSEADLELTLKLKKVLESIHVMLLDHLIVAKNGFFSFNEKNLL